MDVVGEQIVWSFANSDRSAKPFKCTDIRHGPGASARSFMELAKKVAELQFLNRDYVLLFRGQRDDVLTSQGNTSLKPTLFRPVNGAAKLDPFTLQMRFERLRRAEVELVQRFRGRTRETDRLKRQRIMRWSILQHYEICKTPLLDVTHSLRIAASFASCNAADAAFIFVLGVPNLSGAITASAEAGLQIIRLASVCPPSAVRPHIQEGYLLGEYPDIGDYDQKQNYPMYEIDFGRRLIGKFRFNPRTFWTNDTFPPVPDNALYPNDHDPLYTISREIRNTIGNE